MDGELIGLERPKLGKQYNRNIILYRVFKQIPASRYKNTLINKGISISGSGEI